MTVKVQVFQAFNFYKFAGKKKKNFQIAQSFAFFSFLFKIGNSNLHSKSKLWLKVQKR